MERWTTGPTWARAGFPDFVAATDFSDLNDIATGCAVVYLYWLRSQGISAAIIVQAGGKSLADNYTVITGKASAYNDLCNAVAGIPINSDNPF